MAAAAAGGSSGVPEPFTPCDPLYLSIPQADSERQLRQEAEDGGEQLAADLQELQLHCAKV